MSDLLRVRAKGENGSLAWEFVDQAMGICRIELDQAPDFKINNGDIWQVELVDRKTSGKRPNQKVTCVVRLIALLQQLKSWQTARQLDDFWMEEKQLAEILIMLHTGEDVILVGDKGTGKTQFSFALARTLGWQEPCKVDNAMIKKTTDLFGANKAQEGSTFFVRSALMDYIERAMIAEKQGLDTQFLVILDEINRVHSKANEALHGLFDDTRQITILTTEGSKLIRLPGNIHFIGTMNEGYAGTFELDEALKDRFFPVKMQAMPLDMEVNRLVAETHITEKQALDIVRVARKLREFSTVKGLDYSPSYRHCRQAGKLVANGQDVVSAIIAALLGWYRGTLVLDSKGDPVEAKSDIAQAYSALRSVAAVHLKDDINKAVGT